MIFLRRCMAFGLASKGKEKDIMRKYKNKKKERCCQSIGGDWRKETKRGCPSTLLAHGPTHTPPAHHITLANGPVSVLGHLSYCCRDYTVVYCYCDTSLGHGVLDGQCERAMASCLVLLPSWDAHIAITIYSSNRHLPWSA